MREINYTKLLTSPGYPPQYSPEVFDNVMKQVSNFEENAITV